MYFPENAVKRAMTIPKVLVRAINDEYGECKLQTLGMCSPCAPGHRPFQSLRIVHIRPIRNPIETPQTIGRAPPVLGHTSRPATAHA